MQDECKTRYPIMLIHGLGFRDRKLLNYWGRIPAALEAHGARLFYGGQDSYGSVEENARQLQESILQALKETGAKKINLIAHSKGGLDARFLISRLDMAEKIASLTTVATPHHGSRTVDILLRLPDILVRFSAVLANLWYRLLGDRKPDSYRVFHQFSRRLSQQFNEENPNMPGVYYQSYAFVMSHFFSDFILWFPHLLVWLAEGENDGLITVRSARWAEFRGVYRGATGRGVSHCDEVDMRRRRFTQKRVSGRVSDITEFYIELCSDLRKMDF